MLKENKSHVFNIHVQNNNTRIFIIQLFLECCTVRCVMRSYYFNVHSYENGMPCPSIICIYIIVIPRPFKIIIIIIDF